MITGLWDWKRDKNKALSNLNTFQIADGTGYAWEYEIVPMMLSYRGEIAVCIEYIARDNFNGDLKVGLKAIETSKELSLPFKIKGEQGKCNG